MPKGLSQVVRDHLSKCTSATVAAVEVYNRPGPRFRTAHYVILIVIAWTAFFHALAFKKRIRPWYRTKETASLTGRAVRYDRIDNEVRHWDLRECLAQHFGGTHPPERKNLEFLIGLRNKIEHRHLPMLDAGLYGECQAALLNLEAYLVEHFGARYAMQDQLAISLQFTRSTPPAKTKALKAVASTTKSVRQYVETYRGSLPNEILSDSRYSFSVFLVPKLVNRDKLADACVEFVNFDPSNPEDIAKMDRLSVVIREKPLTTHSPTHVIQTVANRIPYHFTKAYHTAAWRHFQIRPERDSTSPQATNARFCVYDPRHKDWGYTDLWIEKLVSDLQNPERFLAITGFPAKPKRH